MIKEVWLKTKEANGDEVYCVYPSNVFSIVRL